MPDYFYRAIEKDGSVVEGSLVADEERIVIDDLQAKGLIPLSVVISEKKVSGFTISLSDIFSNVKKREVLDFTEEFATLISAGLPIDRSLKILLNVTEGKKLKNVISEVLYSVEEGSTLAEAFSKHPKVFSKLYVNMVRAGEAGGALDLVLDKLAEFLDSSQQTKDFIISALIYPVLLVFVGLASVIVLMTFVIPKFTVIFEDMNKALPMSTQILINISRFFTNGYPFILAGVIAVYMLFKAYVKTDSGRRFYDLLKLKTAYVGELIKEIEVARFAKTLGVLIKSGVPILNALSIVKDIVGNRVIADSLADVLRGLKEGEGISKPLKLTNQFPPLAIHMIVVGEETGKLDEMLIKVSERYEKDVRTSIKRLLAIVEPAMILFMGIIVGFIVISMLMAIFSINDLPF